jgi:hypothetical protein
MMTLDADLVEATEEVCQREHLAARTRLALLRVEREAHRAGWGTRPPTLWRVEYDPGRHYVHGKFSYNNTGLLMATTAQCDGDLTEGLMRTALCMEIAREQLGEAGLPRHEDMFESDHPDERFYGWAFCSEAYALPPTADAMAAARAGRISEHPDRLLARMVTFAARDGLTWWVVRVQGEPVQVAMWRPESDKAPTGVVGHALARMTGAMVGNVVPVPPLAPVAVPDAGGWISGACDGPEAEA